MLKPKGTQVALHLDPDKWIWLYMDDQRKGWLAPEQAMPKVHIAAQQHFIDCLESRGEFGTDAEEAIKTMVLDYACYESAEEGRGEEIRNL